MSIPQEIDFGVFSGDYSSARMYHCRARQFLDEGMHYSVVFNVASVALENYLIALCSLYGVDPGNHNYTCLMDAVELVIDIPPELNTAIRSLDQIFGICSIEHYHHGLPEESDMRRVLGMCDDISGFFDLARIEAIRQAYIERQEELA